MKEQSFEVKTHELLMEAELLLNLDYEVIRKERFIKGVFCPHCLKKDGKSVSNFIRYGFVNGTRWQRYYCRHCKHIFSDLTRTFFHRSRNVRKWPLFIQYIMIDKLPLKQIAAKLELHINTIYTLNKKLTAFFSEYLPSKQFLPSDQSSYDVTTVTIKCSNKSISSNKDYQHLPETMERSTFVPLTIAVHRENPSHVLFAVSTNQICSTNSSTSPTLSKVKEKFATYMKNKSVNVCNLQCHLTNFRMATLIEAVNPAILPNEIFKICLDKDRLSRSNRLLKRLI